MLQVSPRSLELRWGRVCGALELLSEACDGGRVGASDSWRRAAIWVRLAGVMAAAIFLNCADACALFGCCVLVCVHLGLHVVVSVRVNDGCVYVCIVARVCVHVKL